MPYKDPEKQKQAQRESHERRKQTEVWAEAQRESRQKRKNVVIEIKESTPCADCGNYYPHYVMDFDHRDPSIKTMNVSRMVSLRGVETILEEIAKCDLVCANCHRERTFGVGGKHM